MVFKYTTNIKDNKGITLIEIVIALFIIAVLSLILIANFPAMLRQFALSRATYTLAQNLRKTEDMGLSGVNIYDKNGYQIKLNSNGGYGIYADLLNLDSITHRPEQYIIYADVDGSSTYNGDTNYTLCSSEDQGALANGVPAIPLQTDCVITKIKVSDENPNLYIKNFYDASDKPLSATSISINFMPPGPKINIQDNMGGKYLNSTIGIILGLSDGSSAERNVQVNTSGLINVK